MTMRNPLLAALLLAAACGTSKPAPAPAPEPAPSQERAELMRTLEITPSHKESRPWEHEPRVLVLRVGRQSVEVDAAGTPATVANVGGAIDTTALAAAIGDKGFDGGADVLLADDATYEGLVAAMDVAKQKGIAFIGIEAPADPSDAAAEAPPPTTPAGEPSSPEALKAAPILIISTTDVTLRLRDGAPQTTIALGKVADLLAHPGPEIPALRTAVGAMSPRPSLTILQAEPSTTGALFNRAFRTLKRMGVENVLLAIKSKS
jgi:hypothetical protein